MNCFCCIVGTFEMLPWKMNQKSYKNCLFRSFSYQMSAVAGEKSKDAMPFFLNIFYSPNKIRQIFEARWRLAVERDIFMLAKTLVVNKYMLY